MRSTVAMAVHSSVTKKTLVSRSFSCGNRGVNGTVSRKAKRN
jgi:hypothetical protein